MDFHPNNAIYFQRIVSFKEYVTISYHSKLNLNLSPRTKKKKNRFLERCLDPIEICFILFINYLEELCIYISEHFKELFS